MFLGVLDLASGEVSLYYADRNCDPQQRRFPGHEELVRQGIIQTKAVRGFCFQLKGHQIWRFYRNSVLNGELPFSCLSAHEMDKIMAVLGLEMSDDFESYP